MQVNAYNTILSDLAINQADGIKLFDTIKLVNPSSLFISFANIKFVSTAFLNESIGKYAQLYPIDISNIKFNSNSLSAVAFFLAFLSIFKLTSVGNLPLIYSSEALKTSSIHLYPLNEIFAGVFSLFSILRS